MAPNHEIVFASGAVNRRINDLPEAAELALDALRRDPLGEDRERTIGEIVELHQKYGYDASVLYPYFLEIINDNTRFLDIDISDEVFNASSSDPTQHEIEVELFARYKGAKEADDITPEFAISRSRRADMLKWMATLLVNKKTEPRAYIPAYEVQSNNRSNIAALPMKAKTA